MFSDSEVEKIYYTIGEVCKLVGVETYVLRYWETEFEELSPRKDSGGKRMYERRDIEMALRIKELLYDERYTIEGARRRLKSYTSDGDGVISGATAMYLRYYLLLDDLKKELLEVQALLAPGGEEEQK